MSVDGGALPMEGRHGAVCQQIRAAYASLTRTERRVADVVLANPAAALETATARLAAAAQVSQPQVIRFCRAVGFHGVSSLKLALAASLASGADAPTGHPLLTRSLQALVHVDRARLATAAKTLAGARQIDVFADAPHAPLLDLALGMLWRLGLPARPVQPDGQPQAPVCLALGASPGPRTLVILIAESPQPGNALLQQLVTGGEPEAAPTLLATLMLQLLLAELSSAIQARTATLTTA